MARGAVRQMARIVMVEKFLWDFLLKGGVSELVSEHCRLC